MNGFGFGICALLLVACGGSSAGDAWLGQAGSAGASPTPTTGEVGSHVWSDSSAEIEVRTHEATFDEYTLVSERSTCWSVKREQMSDAQRAVLEALVLVPLAPNCIADAYRYSELTVVDGNGARSVYRDTGCNSFAVPGAKGMLAGDWSAGLEQGEGVPCEPWPEP